MTLKKNEVDDGIQMAYLPGFLDDMEEAGDVEGLAEYWATIHDAQAKLGAWKFQINQRIERSMKARDAELAESDNVKVTYKGSLVWDRNHLLTLKEHMSPEAWDQLLTEQQDPPERTLNMTAVKGLRKLGGEPKKIIDASETTSDPSLKLVRKKVKE